MWNTGALGNHQVPFVNKLEPVEIIKIEKVENLIKVSDEIIFILKNHLIKIDDHLRAKFLKLHCGSFLLVINCKLASNYFLKAVNCAAG